MIRSLASEAQDVERETGLLVVGGGIAGLLIATQVAARGRRVIVLESGGLRQDAETHPLNDVEHLRSVYSGAASGRFRCIGGTSTRWGGAMLPFLKSKLTDGWPVAHEELMRLVPEVESLFGLPPGPYEVPDLVGGDGAFVPRLAKWPAFAKRNVAALLDAALVASSGPETWLDAHATGFELAADGRLHAVTAEAPNGRRLKVSAGRVVIAAGAIESTRLLLLLDRAVGERLFAPHDVLGRYFHDHLSTIVGDVDPLDRDALNRVVGFRFEGASMRNLRFEASEDVAKRVRAGFAHVAFASDAGSGFDALRGVYRRLQQRQLPEARSLLQLAGTLPWLARAAWWRYRERRLFYPADAAIQLHMVIEQDARRDNRILLSANRHDAYRLPLAAIDWSCSQEDRAALTGATDALLRWWQASGLAGLATVCRRAPGAAEAELAKGGGIYHPGGSTRMGRTAGDGVVNADLRVFGVPNLSVASTSVFPTGGGANPTMTLMLMALRLAGTIDR